MTWLLASGQRRVSAAGSGSELLLSNEDPKGPLRDFTTGTGFARAKLSEIRSSRR
jgi:hypothetical protein